MSDARNSIEHVCPNCISPESVTSCGKCGQQHVKSPFPAKLMGLSRNPGQVCLEYGNELLRRFTWHIACGEIPTTVL